MPLHRHLVLLMLLAMLPRLVALDTPPADTTYAVVPMAALGMPGYLQTIRDPSLGNLLTRVTDLAAFGYANDPTVTMLKQSYAKDAVWNADESLMLILQTKATQGALLDGTTYRYLRPLPSFANQMRIWSNVDPRVLYGVQTNPALFKKLTLGATAAQDSVQIVQDFSGKYSDLSLGDYEGNLSNDDRLAVFYGTWKSDASTYDIISYDIANRVILGVETHVGRMSGGRRTDSDLATATPSGQYVAVDVQPSNVFRLYDRNMKYLRTLGGSSHCDFTYDAFGDEVVVGHASSTGDIQHEYIVSYRLADGRKRQETPIGKIDNPIHVSCRNTRRPGWAYVSEFAYVTPSQPVSWYNTHFNYNEVIAVRLDGSGVVERWGKEHHNTSASFDYNANRGYARSPMAVPSRKGDRVVFASDWGDISANAFIHTYVTSWPASVQPVNHPPVAAGQSMTIAEDTAKAVALSATDADGDALTYAIATGPAHGVLAGSGANRTYTPAANWNGTDSFTFKANDGAVDSNAATVSITVTAVNDVPIAVAQSVTAESNAAKAITLVGMDAEGGALSYAIVANPIHGALSGSGAIRTYAPTPGYAGPDSFAFTVNDGMATSTAATVSITVNAAARLTLSTDNQYTDLYVNGARLAPGANASNWRIADSFATSGTVGAVAVRVVNSEPGADWAGFIAKITQPDGTVIVSDGSWRVYSGTPANDANGRSWHDPDFDDSLWSSASSGGAYGVAPWGTQSGLSGLAGAQWIWSGTLRLGTSPIYLRKRIGTLAEPTAPSGSG